MADNHTAFKGGSAPIGTPTAAGRPSATPASITPADAKSIIDVVTLCQSPSVLSKDGEAYVGKIVDTLNASGRQSKATKIMGANYEARVIEYNGNYVVLVFAETYTPGVDTFPVAGVLDDLKNMMTASHLDPSHIVQFLVVTKEDYVRADQMAAFIVNQFLAYDNTAVKNLSAAQFSGRNFRITTDINKVRQFINQVYPMSTAPRADVGMLLFAQEPIPNSLARDGRPEMRETPIVAVTGYTDFSYAQCGNIYAQQTKFAPMFIITGIHSKLPSPKIGAIGLALASWMFIRQGSWIEQFSSFTKGSPDLGNLLTDDKGKVVHVANLNDRNKILDLYMSTKIPYLALDLQLGAPMIPGLKDLFSDKAMFNHMVDTFTGCDGAATAQNPMQIALCRFDGRVRINQNGISDYVDTRTVDFLQLVQSGVGPAEAAEFLRQTTEPKSKCDALKHFYKDAELLYVTSRAILNPTYVDAISMDLGQTLKVQVDSGFAPNVVDTSSLAAFQAMGAGMLPQFMMPNGGAMSFSGGYFY